MKEKIKSFSALLAFCVIFCTFAFAQSQATNGTSAGKIDHVRYANDYNGQSGSDKQDAAISDVGSGPGVVITAPGTGPGHATNYKNDVPIIDLRQTSDIIENRDVDPDRAAVVLLENHLGEFTTRPLSGTVILTRGSKEVRGIGTKFRSEIIGPGVHYGRSIKLNTDDASSWAEIAMVRSDTEATLKVPYPGAGCAGSSCTSGDASYFITELGFAIRNLATAGTPNTLLGGESVGLTVVSNRTGGERGLYGANFNVTYQTPTSPVQGQALGLEIDLNNKSGADDNTGSSTIGLDILSGGTNHPHAGIIVNSTTNHRTNANNWLRGAFITGWSQVGVLVSGSRDHLQFYTGAPPDSNPQMGGRNQSDSAYIWNINNDGSAQFTSVTLHPYTVGALPHPSPSNAGAMVRVSDSTEVMGEGQACVGGSNHTALAFSDGTKWKCF